MPKNASPRPEDHVVVLFGATGDLAKRKLLPGLFHLHAAGLLPREYRVIGTSPPKFALTEEQLGELEYRVTKWVEKVGGKSPHVYIDIPVEKPGDPRLFMDYHTEMEKRPKPDYSQNQVLGWFEFLRSSELCFGMGVEKSNKS